MNIVKIILNLNQDTLINYCNIIHLKHIERKKEKNLPGLFDL